MNAPGALPNRQASLKQQAAEYAVRRIQSGMTVGLGTGSTAMFAIRRIGELLQSGELRDIVAFATSRQSSEAAVALGIPMLPEDLPGSIDLTIDGADEVDPQLDLIKGGGGALLREKLVAQATAREIIVVDESKLSPRLGTLHVLPIEVLPFGWRSTARYVESLGAKYLLRQTPDGREYRTDQGNLILDCDFGPIPEATKLARQLEARAGIVEHGLFLGLTDAVIVAGASGVRELRRS
ncbi:MAG TPA: ribose-5-phosphate isomerase RpiA [Candidatus Binatia bacterium]|nr:ribose-5-phosphate isomerase RpiA [Candidatus Binatia bacterium]